MAEPYQSLLKHKREHIRYSIRRIVRECQLSLGMYQKIEERTKPAPLSYAFALAEFYGSEPSDMFGADGYAIQLRDSEEYNPAQLLLQSEGYRWVVGVERVGI